MKFKIFFLTLIILLTGAVQVEALETSTNEIPRLFWGRPKIEFTGSDNLNYVYYGSSKDTAIIYSTAPETLPSFQYNPAGMLTGCNMYSSMDFSAGSQSICFSFASGTNGVIPTLIEGKAYANGLLKWALPVMKYPNINIIGDTSNTSSNFAYWGRHLNQVNNGTNLSNSFWKLSNYSISNQSQSYWSGDNATMTSTIKRLKENAKTLADPLLPSQFDGVCGSGFNQCSEITQYPEGRVWKYDGDFSAGGVTYKNKSTVIVPNGLKLNGDIKYNDSYSDGANIGFIVEAGDVEITNNSGNLVTIEASIFAPNGSIIVKGDNIKLIGSFVAQDFSATGTNITISYDSRKEASYPPGFRDLKLPLISGE